MAGLSFITRRIIGVLPNPCIRNHKDKKSSAQVAQKTLLDHFNDGVLNNLGKTKDLALKPIYHFTAWGKHFLGDRMPKELEVFGDSMKSTKNWLAVAEFPGKILKLARSVVNLSPVNIFFDGAECVNPAHDITSEAVKAGIVQVSKETMRQFSLWNYGALLVGQTKLGCEAISKLAKEKLTSAQQFLGSLGLGKNASYVALAITGLAMGGQASIWILVFSTSALFFSNAHFYYDKIVEPNKQAQLKA
jgi:hypothetical protein